MELIVNVPKSQNKKKCNEILKSYTIENGSSLRSTEHYVIYHGAARDRLEIQEL